MSAEIAFVTSGKYLSLKTHMCTNIIIVTLKAHIHMLININIGQGTCQREQHH